MGKKVFANDMEIAHEAGDGKVIAAFPDVCLSPPPPPTGPVPVPYPNTSFAKDLKEGSSTVKIAGKPAALFGQSYYATSPLGNEAATRQFGGAVITHTITGKTYFQASSMNVKFEGKNVCRHLDLSTSNHASQPGSTPPNPNLEAMELAKLEDALDVCACCDGPKHSQGAAMTFDDWYGLNEKDATGAPTAKALERTAFVEKVKNKKAHGCTCKGRVLPESPCNVFRKPVKTTEKDNIASLHRRNAKKYRRSMGAPESASAAMAKFSVPLQAAEKIVKVNHLTPKNAGGCPTGDKNLQLHSSLCSVCQGFDDAFGDWQREVPTVR